MVDQAWHQIVYFEPPPEVRSEEKEDFLAKLEALQEQADMVIFCGSVPPSFEEFHEEALWIGSQRSATGRVDKKVQDPVS